MKIRKIAERVLDIAGIVIPQGAAAKVISYVILWGVKKLLKNPESHIDNKLHKVVENVIHGVFSTDDILNKEKLKKQLIIDEGCIKEVYLDSKGYPTFGIGHLVKPKDPEYFELKVNVPFVFDKSLSKDEKQARLDASGYRLAVSDERINQAFESDVDSHCDDCLDIFPNFATFDEEVKQIVANMVFNLGKGGFSKFKKLIAAINAKDYLKAAIEMKDSKWYSDVGNRAKRLIKRMKKLAKSY